MNDECRADLWAEAALPRPWSPESRDADPLDGAASSAPGFSCLTEVELFADLSPEEIHAMDLMAPARFVGRGELVFSQAQPVTALFILKAGRVRVFRVAEDGKALTMAILEPGAVFGEMLLVGQRMYDNYAEAIEDSMICQLSVREVEKFLLSDPRIAVRISRLLGERVARLEERLEDLALRPLTARVASMLLSMSESAPASRFGAARLGSARGGSARLGSARLGSARGGSARPGRGPTVRLTHEQIAGLLGATREGTSKVLADFASRGLIRQGRGRITLLDAGALRGVARGQR